MSEIEYNNKKIIELKRRENSLMPYIDDSFNRVEKNANLNIKKSSKTNKVFERHILEPNIVLCKSMTYDISALDKSFGLHPTSISTNCCIDEIGSIVCESVGDIVVKNEEKKQDVSNILKNRKCFLKDIHEHDEESHIHFSCENDLITIETILKDLNNKIIS